MPATPLFTRCHPPSCRLWQEVLYLAPKHSSDVILQRGQHRGGCAEEETRKGPRAQVSTSAACLSPEPGVPEKSLCPLHTLPRARHGTSTTVPIVEDTKPPRKGHWSQDLEVAKNEAKQSGETEGGAKTGLNHVLGQLASGPLSPVRRGCGWRGPGLLPAWAPFLCGKPITVPSSLSRGSESVFQNGDP